mgnify:CR=1 FL=1
MNFDYSDKVKHLQAKLLAFMDAHIYPNEQRFFEEIAANRAKGNAWVPTQLVEELKPLAQKAGLWNLFLPHSPRAPTGLSNLVVAVGFALMLAGLACVTRVARRRGAGDRAVAREPALGLAARDRRVVGVAEGDDVAGDPSTGRPDHRLIGIGHDDRVHVGPVVDVQR